MEEPWFEFSEGRPRKIVERVVFRKTKSPTQTRQVTGTKQKVNVPNRAISFPSDLSLSLPMVRQSRHFLPKFVHFFVVLGSLRTLAAFSSQVPDLSSPMFGARLGVRTAAGVSAKVSGLRGGYALHRSGLYLMRLSCTRTAPQLFSSDAFDGEEGNFNGTSAKPLYQPNHLRSTSMLSRMYMKPSSRPR